MANRTMNVNGAMPGKGPQGMMQRAANNMNNFNGNNNNQQQFNFTSTARNQQLRVVVLGGTVEVGAPRFQLADQPRAKRRAGLLSGLFLRRAIVYVGHACAS